MENIKRGGCHMTLVQKEFLVEATNPKLNIGRFDANFSFKDATALWQKISEKLNAMPGAYKDWKGWRKAWYDMKAGAKTKNSQMRKHNSGTGGGQQINLEITPIEGRISNLIGPTSLTGDNNVMETAINVEHFRNSATALNTEGTNQPFDEVFNVEPILETIEIETNTDVRTRTNTPSQHLISNIQFVPGNESVEWKLYA